MKWDTEKLEEMTKTQNEFTKTKLNYTKIAEKYFEMIEITRKNGDVLPLAFKDVEVAYNGKIKDDLNSILDGSYQISYVVSLFICIYQTTHKIIQHVFTIIRCFIVR